MPCCPLAEVQGAYAVWAGRAMLFCQAARPWLVPLRRDVAVVGDLVRQVARVVGRRCRHPPLTAKTGRLVAATRPLVAHVRDDRVTHLPSARRWWRRCVQSSMRWDASFAP